MAEGSGEEESEDDSVTVHVGLPQRMGKKVLQHVQQCVKALCQFWLQAQVRKLGGALTCLRVPRATTARARGLCWLPCLSGEY